MKFLKKYRWILGLVIIILAFAGWIYYSNNNNQSVIKPSTVWTPPGDDWMKKWYDCRDIDCSTEIMKQNGASVEAINFAKLLPEEQGYLGDFKEMGKIDLGTVMFPKRANTNEITYFLNGSPPLLSTDIINDNEKNVMESAKQDPLYNEMKAKYSNIELWGVGPEFVEKSGNDFIFKYRFVDGCHACNTEYSTKISFNFDSKGKFLNIKFINIEKS